MAIQDNWFVVRALRNGKIEIEAGEKDGECVARMSVYVDADENKAVRYLCQHRSGTTQYGVTTYGKLKVLSNFRIRESSEGKNIGHYLIDGITEKEAKNAFSNHKNV